MVGKAYIHKRGTMGVTPGYDIMRLLEEMVKLRKVLKDLRRAELVAAKEHDMIRAAAREGAGDGTSAQSPPTSDSHGRRESDADKLRHESSQALDSAEYDRHADEMCDQDSAGLSQIFRRKSLPPHGDTS